MKDETKKKLFKLIKILGGIVCIIAGLALSGFGITQFFPEKQYGTGNV